MARIRSIKPEIRRSLTVSSWPIPVRWTFAGLWGYLDDEGRGVDDARLIKAELYPLDDDITARKVEVHLATIEKNGPLCRYIVDGKHYLHVTSWSEHQRVNRPSPSRIPHCPTHEDAPSGHGRFSESSRRDHGARTDDSLRARKEHGTGSMEHGTGGSAAEPGDQSDGPSAPSVAASLTRPTPIERPDIERVCQHLADRIEANGSKRPTVTAKWRDTARLMLDRDGRTEAQILGAIDWCQADGFWCGVVLSMPKLREKYDQLRLQAGTRRNGTPTAGAGGVRPSTTDERVGAGLALARKFAERDGHDLPQLPLGGTA